MNQIAKAIRKSTGLTLKQFAEERLKSKWGSFSVRLRKNRLYPNEYIYICLVTGQKFSDLFEDSFHNIMLLRGDESVTKSINELLGNDGWSLLNSIIDSPLVINNQDTVEEEALLHINQLHQDISPVPEEKIMKSVMAKAGTLKNPVAKPSPQIIAPAPKEIIPPKEEEEEVFVFIETYNK